MIETAKSRLFVIILLLACQAILFPMFAQQPVNSDVGVYANQDEFIQTPNQYIGEQVVTGGFVQQTNPLLIEVETTQGTHDVTITSAGLSPRKGDKVRVYGILTAPKTIESSNAFVVPQGGLWYTWSVSFFAGLWVLFRLIRYWTVDLSSLSFYSRETPLSIREIIHSIPRQGGKDNA